MDKIGFLDYLKKKGLDGEAARRQLAIADHLDTMMSARNVAKGSGCGSRAARSLIDALVQSGEDSVDNILAILRYGYFVRNDEVYVEALTYLDGVEAMDNLYARLGRIAGEGVRDRIFSKIGPVTPGTDLKARSAAMRTVIGEVLSGLDKDRLDELFASSFRDLDDSHYSSEAGLLAGSNGVDGYIEAKKSEFIGDLKSCMDEGRLFFGQEITPAVMELVTSDPEMAFGRREGGSVYVTKIPFRADMWLKEKDPLKRRYLYSHCPWARESILSEEGTVPSEFCRCSAGFHKKPWEAALGRLVGCDVLESVLAGDDRCRFRIHID